MWKISNIYLLLLLLFYKDGYGIISDKSADYPIKIFSSSHYPTYEDWCMGINSCFRARPEKDYQAVQLIKKYPEYFEKLAYQIRDATSTANTIELLTLLNEDAKNSQTIQTIIGGIYPNQEFVRWLEKIYKQAEGDDILDNLLK